MEFYLHHDRHPLFHKEFGVPIMPEISSGAAKKLRLPPPFEGVNANFCKNPLCQTLASGARSEIQTSDPLTLSLAKRQIVPDTAHFIARRLKRSDMADVLPHLFKVGAINSRCWSLLPSRWRQLVPRIMSDVLPRCLSDCAGLERRGVISSVQASITKLSGAARSDLALSLRGNLYARTDRI